MPGNSNGIGKGYLYKTPSSLATNYNICQLKSGNMELKGKQ